MAELVADCPRCRSGRTTFDVSYAHVTGEEYGWMNIAEAHRVCRRCNLGTIFQLKQSQAGREHSKAFQDGLHKLSLSLNRIATIGGFVSLKDAAPEPPPEHLPAKVRAVFNEGTTCLKVQCFNAAGAMFRLCVDLATKDLLPAENVEGLNATIRRSLGLRLQWLFTTRRLQAALEDLSTAVKDDGNDGAHDGTLSEEDAKDLMDFTTALLERLYTEPERLRLALERRDGRRNSER